MKKRILKKLLNKYTSTVASDHYMLFILVDCDLLLFIVILVLKDVNDFPYLIA